MYNKNQEMWTVHMTPIPVSDRYELVSLQGRDNIIVYWNM